jgi:hypothetical protein
LSSYGQCVRNRSASLCTVRVVTRDYDAQLLESVAVRRRRLRDTLLFGSMANRRSHEENVSRAIAGITIAGVLAAGCVGYASIRKQISQQTQPNSPAAATPTAENR